MPQNISEDCESNGYPSAVGAERGHWGSVFHRVEKLASSGGRPTICWILAGSEPVQAASVDSLLNVRGRVFRADKLIHRYVDTCI